MGRSAFSGWCRRAAPCSRPARIAFTMMLGFALGAGSVMVLTQAAKPVESKSSPASLPVPAAATPAPNAAIALDSQADLQRTLRHRAAKSEQSMQALSSDYVAWLSVLARTAERARLREESREQYQELRLSSVGFDALRRDSEAVLTVVEHRQLLGLLDKLERAASRAQEPRGLKSAEKGLPF